MNNKNKAISPIIAVILLIGVAIGAAALAYSWYMGIQKGTQAVGGTAAGQTAQASSAAMEIVDIDSNKNLTIKNIGSVTLTNIKCTYDSSACSGSISSLPPGSTSTTIQCSGISGVKTITCTSDEGATATYQYVG